MWKWILLFFSLSYCVFAIQSGDMLMYLSLARDFLLQGRWEQVDPYLYPATDGQLVWIHEYLSHLIFYGAWSAFGAPGLIFLKSIALGSMFWIALRSDPNEHHRSFLFVMLWVLAIVAGSFRYIERASMFSDLFTVLIVYWLLRSERIDRSLVLKVSILFLVWVQLHPGFPIGLIFLGAWTCWRFLTDKAFRNARIAWLAIPVLCLLANPTGIEGALYPFQFALNEAASLKRFNMEWFPSYHPAFRFAPEVLAFWALSIACLALFLKERATISLRFVFALVAFALCAQSVRFMPWASLVMVMSVKPLAVTRVAWMTRPAVRAALAAVLVILGARNLIFGYHSSSGPRLPKLAFDRKFFPDETLRVLRESPIPGRLYNSHDLGSSLIWNRLTPVFHHGFVTDMKFVENDVLPAMGTQEQFLNLAAKYGWTMLLVDKYGGYRELHRILSPLTEWKIVAEDEAAYLIYKIN